MSENERILNAAGYLLEVSANNGDLQAAVDEIYDEYGYIVASEAVMTAELDLDF